jgi:hypothetical protein
VTRDALALRQSVAAPRAAGHRVSKHRVSKHRLPGPGVPGQEISNSGVWRQAATGFAQRIKRAARSRVQRTPHKPLRKGLGRHGGTAVSSRPCTILGRCVGGIETQRAHRAGKDKTRARACCDARAATPEAPETQVAFGATRVGTLLSRLQMHLRTARFLAELRQDAMWEAGCDDAAMAMEQLESEMSPNSLHASIRPEIAPRPRVAAVHRGRVQGRVQAKPRSCGPVARNAATSRAAARSVAANTAATHAMLQSAARNCKRVLGAPPSTSALAVRRQCTARTRVVFQSALTTTPVTLLAVPPPAKPLSHSAGTLTAHVKGQR